MVAMNAELQTAIGTDKLVKGWDKLAIFQNEKDRPESYWLRS